MIRFIHSFYGWNTVTKRISTISWLGGCAYSKLFGNEQPTEPAFPYSTTTGGKKCGVITDHAESPSAIFLEVNA